MIRSDVLAEQSSRDGSAQTWRARWRGEPAAFNSVLVLLAAIVRSRWEAHTVTGGDARDGWAASTSYGLVPPYSMAFLRATGGSAPGQASTAYGSHPIVSDHASMKDVHIEAVYQIDGKRYSHLCNGVYGGSA